jgi:hypothetical protein
MALGSAAADLRLKNIMGGQPASGQYTGPSSFGAPGDRGPSIPAAQKPPILKKIGMAARKKSTPYA